MREQIVHTAIENLRKTTGIEGFWREQEPLDGVLDLTVNGRNLQFELKVKGEIRAHQLEHLENLFHQHKNFMLLANRIFPKIKEELRQKEISYLEANGNIFLKKKGLFLLIDTEKTIQNTKTNGNRAFTKTGLKVLFYLLQNKDAINFTHRELAEKAGVGLGNIPQVIHGLKQTGFIFPLNNKNFIWENRKELLGRWITAFAMVLRPRLKRERFTFKGNWQDLKFNTHLTVWGGEPAGDILTNYLRPGKYLIYTRENRLDLIKTYGLIPDNEGEIEVLEMFWNNEDAIAAPPVLIYADLILEGGKRNQETADKIFYEYIRPNL